MEKLEFAQLGNVIKRGFSVLMANPVIFLPAAISVWVQGYFSSRLVVDPHAPLVWADFIVNLGLASFFSLLGGIILMKMSFDALAGKADLGAALPLVVSKFFPLIGAMFLYLASVVVGSVLFVVPGLIIAVKLVFPVYLIVLEDYGVMEAFSVGWKMTAGRWWWVFALVFMGAPLYGLASVVVALLPTSLQLIARFTCDLFYQTLGVAVLTSAFVLLREIDAQ